MRVLVFLTVIISTACGWVEWKDLHVGKSLLPSTQDAARSAGWRPVSKDGDLQISWNMKDNDAKFLIAFDGQKNIAGIRVNQLESEIDHNYKGIYTKSGLFDRTSMNGKKFFTSTTIFSAENILRNGGRWKLPTDEVALALLVKRGNGYEQIDREGCQHSQTSTVEQGCQPKYGLVFSDFGSDSSCDSLSPFYTMWDTHDTGNLIGFGWLVFGNKVSHSKVVTVNDLKTLFPNRPKCLDDIAATGGLRAVEVWYSLEASLGSSCSSGIWSDIHCDRRMRSMYTIL